MNVLKPPPDHLEDLPVIFDFALIPVDGFHQDENGEWVDEEEADEDNSVLADAPGYMIAEPRALMANSPRKPQVKALGPLRRELRKQPIPKKPLQGKDVIAIRRALARAKIIRWKPGGKFSPIAGPPFYAALRKFQKRKGLPVDGVYGPRTHRALGPRFDAYAIKLYHEAKIGVTGAELKRQKIRAQWLYLVHMREYVGYTMGASRMTIVRHNLVIGNLFRRGTIWEDCSSIIRGICKLVGMKDIHNFGYQHPWGFTGTMTRTGFPVSPRLENLKIGDCFLTGRNPWVHTWQYIGSGLAGSHGKMSDPRIVPWNYRPVSHCQRYIEED